MIEIKAKRIEIKAKRINDDKDGTALYELFAVETIKDVNDKDVTVPRLVARTDLKFLQDQLALVQAEINAINDLK